MLDASCKNLLIRGVNWIGDGVMTLPALKALRKELHETKISLLVKPWVSPLFENNPHIDEIIAYSDNHKGILGKLKLSWMLNRKKDRESGLSKHLITTDLDLARDFDVRRMKKIKSYRGWRHATGQPVRGQRTRSHFRKGGAVGVAKGKARQAPSVAPAKDAKKK